MMLGVPGGRNSFPPEALVRIFLHSRTLSGIWGIMPGFEVCEELVESQLSRGLSHARELSAANAQASRVTVHPVRSSEGDFLFQVRRLATSHIGEDLLSYGRAPAFNKMLALTSLGTLKNLRCEEPCRHTRITIVLEASGNGYYCTLDRPNVTRRAPLLRWSDSQEITLVWKRGAAHKHDRVYTRSNRKVFLRKPEAVQSELANHQEFLDIGSEFAALQHLDSLNCVADEGLGHAPVLRAVTTLTSPYHYAQNLRGALLDFYGDPTDPDDPKGNDNPWRCDLEKALLGRPPPGRKVLGGVVGLCNPSTPTS